MEGYKSTKVMTADAVELLNRGIQLGAQEREEQLIIERKGRLGGNPYVIIPNDCQVVDLRHLLLPARQFHHHFNEVDSFIDFIKYYKQKNTRLFCIEQEGKFRGVIDDHVPGEPYSDPDGKDLCDERLMVGDLTLAKTPEWKAWSENMEKGLHQIEFALFLEDNGRFVTKPSAAEFLQVALTLEAKKGVNFKSGLRLENGDHKLLFEEDTRTTAGVKGELEIPHDFTIKLRLYQGGDVVSLDGKLRYKLNGGGQIAFFYKFPGLENIVREYVAKIRERVVKEAGLPVWSVSTLA